MVGVPLNPMGLYGGGPPKSYGALWVAPPPLNPMVGVPLNPMGLYGGPPPKCFGEGPPKSYGAL